MTTFDFTNFHHRTQALFAPAAPPNREPDYVSPARSVYWDTTSGVIRASDHWVGFDGCIGQATCRWSLDGDTGGPAWRFGFCPYERFTPRSTAQATLTPEERDRTIALWLDHQGRACTPSAWRASGFGTPPRWLHRVPRGALAATPAAQRLFAAHLDLTAALCARDATINAALAGDPIPWF